MCSSFLAAAHELGCNVEPHSVCFRLLRNSSVLLFSEYSLVSLLRTLSFFPFLPFLGSGAEERDNSM